jgi:hypothetical protein
MGSDVIRIAYVYGRIASRDIFPRTIDNLHTRKVASHPRTQSSTLRPQHTLFGAAEQHYPPAQTLAAHR